MIILFGSTGMLGTYVYSVLSKYYNVLCITRDSFDILNDSWEKLDTIMEHVTKDDVVINCAGIIPQKVNICGSYKIYLRVNTVFPNKIQKLSDLKGFRFIHITTDCVFNGNEKYKSYTEDDLYLQNCTNDIYGVSKLLGEPMNACVIRTSIIGEDLKDKKSLLEWVVSNANGKINGFTNHLWNGVTCLTLANIIKQIISNKLYWCGVRHIFSPRIVSKYELCEIINSIYQLNIKVNIFNTYKMVNRSLASLYDTNTQFNIPEIRYQIEEQKAFYNYKLQPF
jgi:dTDP-4-dehydrorhamnose reductase